MSNRPFIHRRQPKGLIGQIQQVILHPIHFFNHLSEQGETRTWLWAALGILLLVGYSAIRYHAMLTEGTAFDTDAQQQLILAITASGTLILAWVGQILFLALLTMLQGQRPKWGLNLRIVIWASIPLLLMALAQIVFMAAGGALIDIGLLARDTLPQTAADEVKILLANFLRQLTIFNFWRMILFYLGAQTSLKGRWWMALLITILSFATLFLIPTLIQMLNS
jgi:hypothetical protein